MNQTKFRILCSLYLSCNGILIVLILFIQRNNYMFASISFCSFAFSFFTCDSFKSNYRFCENFSSVTMINDVNNTTFRFEHNTIKNNSISFLLLDKIFQELISIVRIVDVFSDAMSLYVLKFISSIWLSINILIF